MVAEQAVRDAGLLRNVAQTDAFKPARGKDRARALHDALPRLLGYSVRLPPSGSISSPVCHAAPPCGSTLDAIQPYSKYCMRMGGLRQFVAHPDSKLTIVPRFSAGALLDNDV
jgi:hypothetical protein